MEKRRNDSGLFLKNYLGTVSAVPRPRAAVHMESRSPYVHSASIDIQNCIKHLTEDDPCNFKNSYEANGIKSNYREELLNEYNSKQQRMVNHNPFETNVNRIDYDDDEKDRKKEKKWTLGGFFRRKCRKDADDSSEDSGDGRKGFLSRRKSKRDRRKPRAKTNGFDVIIPQQKEQQVNGLGKTVDELWGNEVKNAGNGPVRYICRHQPNGVAERPKDTLQVPKQPRKDSNVSRNSSGGSGSLEGRKGRKEVLARAEAKRDRMRDESSSDENDSYHSSSSLNRLTTDGRRVRRHNKRLSKDEESLLQSGDFRAVKSDFEGHRLPHNRWISRAYPDSSDHENVKLSLINHSATPSPARSPRARQKQLTPNIPPPNSYPVNTFPPGVHYPQGRSVPNYNGYPSPKYIHTKDQQVNISQPLLNVNYRKSNRNSEYIQPARRSTSEHSTNRRTLMDYEHFLSSCGSNREKSLSYDQDIHRASYFENDPSDIMVAHYPKTNSVRVHAEQFGDGRNQPLRDPRMISGLYYDFPQRMPKPYENEGESLSVGSVTNSIPVQHPNYQLVQRSASGNSCCNVYENSKEAAYNQIRSNSYQHIPSYINQQSRANPERLKACVQNGVKYPHYRTMTETVTANPVVVKSDAKDKVQKSETLNKPQLNSSVPNLRYYADQNPRSRNPIHITCNATPSPTLEQPCEPPVAKSQQISVKEAITNASDFWKLKDQENLIKMHMKKVTTNSSSKPPITQASSRTERSRSGSPKTKEAPKKVDAKVTKEDIKSGKPVEQKIKAEPQVKHKVDTNLDDALNELESIYNSLRLGDEDLVARAERRDLPTYKSSPQKLTKNDSIIEGKTYDVYPTHEHQRTVPQRRSGVPDKVNDDMAYRRMNAKERAENKKYPSHSYLRSSPALSPVLGDNPNHLIPKETPQEPDVTYDDVVFRNIRHANSTLKIQDPQPPFGIPLGPITPAANSDYLHATPKERFRPTFTSSKVPDVVKDDLAFRNLRKDNMTANLPVVENTDANKNYLLQKKRAVRSLSANLYNLIQKEGACHEVEKNNNILEKDCEKTQSLTDLTEKEGKQALEKRLKQLKEEKSAKRAEFFELSKEQRKKRNSKSNLSWTELAHLNGDFENVPQMDTSTETLTEENGGVQQRLRVNFVTETPEQKTYRSPVVELSKYPAAAPSSTLYTNPFRETAPGSPLDEEQLEDLLSALEKEAKTASEDLGRQLVELELSSEKAQEEKRKSVALSEDKYPSLERRPERTSRNNSVGEEEQPTEEEKPVDMLEKLCSTIQNEMEGTKEEEEEADVGKLTNEIIQITEELIRRETKDRKRSNGFGPVTDLSEILHEMEEQQPKPKDTFQEVYEYNIGLSEGEAAMVDEAPKEEEDNEIERAFEKLHAAVDADDAVVNELLADVTGGSSADREECRSLRPFPNEVSSRNFGVSCGDGSSPGSSNGEGSSQIANDLYGKGDVRDIIKKERLMKMFNTEAKSGTDASPGSKSPPENVRKRIDSYKENRRKELLEKFNYHVEAATAASAKPFKASNRKEDLRGGGCATAKRSPNVPSSDSRRYISRRDQNKTEGGSGSNGECQHSPTVRETRTSRLRAATRNSTGDPISSRTGKTPEKERSATTSSSASSTTNSLNRKEVDKSYKRKSYLNRSHTSEEVQDIHLTSDPGTRRRIMRGSLLDGRTTAEEMPIPANKVDVPKILSNGILMKSTKTLPWSRKSQESNDRSAYVTNGVTNLRKQRSVEEKKNTDNESKSLSSLRRLEERFQSKRSSDSAAKSFSSVDNSPARSTKQNPDDFARRADLLAAATLKMINRLDEINKSNRRVSEVSQFDKPCRSFAKTETKKVPVPDENTAKSSSSSILNHRCSRPKIGTSTRQESPKKVEGGSKPSILKKKILGDAPPYNSDCQRSKPVSILKRKSLSQDESQSKTNLFSGPPVTFSPNVTENENTKRQGILKKRRSLDENEVLRRRSGADVNNVEFKSILKNQRRSSLEDLGGRSRSPDYLPQSILKRKSSRDEETEDAILGGEPQGILKRKSFGGSGHQHVKITDSVIMAAAEVVGEMQISESIRPILKKKSSSEEHSAPELSASEPPRPILKKPSVEVDDIEEKPKKPILKTSRKTSLEEFEDGKRCETGPVRPILKRDSSRSRMPDAAEEGIVLRRAKPNRIGRPLSSSDIDDELHAIFHKRRSLEFQIASAVNLDWELRRAKSVSLNDRIMGEALRRPSSVAERVNTLESFLQTERERAAFSPSPPRKVSPPRSPPGTNQLGAVPKFRVGGAVTHPNEPASFRYSSGSGLSHANGFVNSGEELKAIEGLKESSSEEEVEVCRCNKQSSSVGPASLGSIREATEAKSASSFFTGRQSCPSTDSEASLNELTNDQDDSEYLSAVESCSRRISSLDVNPPGNMEEAKEVAEEIFLLRQSGSVTAKAYLFEELEKFKAAAEEEKKTKPSIKGTSSGMNRYKEKKLLESSVQKYHTQPISSQDVEEAIRNTRNCSHEKSEDVENFEDELSSMSLSERVRLFNEKIRRESNTTPPPPVPGPTRKRGPRFRTQPVTTEEVETAQGQKRISPLAASLMRPPDPDIFGLGVLSVQSMKEKIYDHANAIVNRPRGILKNPPRVESDMLRKSSDSDSSDSEIKSILKSEEQKPGEENTILKGILKQPSADRKDSSSSDDSDIELKTKSRSKFGANLARILQRVEPDKMGDEKTSDREDSPPAGKDVPKLVKNEGVARRRQIAINKLRNSSSLVKSQSHSAVSSICRGKGQTGDRVLNGETDRVRCRGDGWKGEGAEEGSHDGLKRSTTQPLAGLEGERAHDDDMSGASIQERLARLRKSGENDWQKRKTLSSNSEELSVITSGNYLLNETCSLRNRRVTSPEIPKDSEDFRSSILADRLDKLDAAKEGWRKRVPPSDAVQFSVEGKMLGKTEGLRRSPLLQVCTNKAPSSDRKKKCPKPMSFRSRKNQPALSSVPSSPMEVLGNPIARSVSAPGSGQDGLFSLSNVEGPVVSVPKTDDETFTSFFNGLCSDLLREERLDIKDEDLDVVSKMQSSQLLVQKRNVKIQRRRTTLRNPLKMLAARNDLQEYTETKTGIAEKELKRLKIEKASRNSTLAIEALAGLASQEDFTAINLKKASDGGVNSHAPPYKNLMLLQVKGRRHVQTRMVEPVARSVNAGDCFILVTPKKVFNYIGEYANVIEKSRSAEISLHIQQMSDLGCGASSVITIGGGGRATSEQVREFWKLLGGDRSDERAAGHPDEDEIFESAIIDTNMVYEVVHDELVPIEAFWGSLPRIEVLDSNKVLVFDFGSEFYVWIGKNVNIPDRKTALKLAKELWEDGYDYAECDICPLTLDAYFDSIDGPDEIPEAKKAGPIRPSWALFAKITENMETVLFREKFLDWPDYSRVIRRSKKDEMDHSEGTSVIEVKPCDAEAMLNHIRSEPDLVLEGSHLGRGIRYFEEETRRCAEIATKDITVWHISEYEYSELPAESLGQFHAEDSYVVRWHYMITITGRELSGQPSKHLTVGRDRYAYFCWQGKDSPINDKGAAACLTVELDKEHGPQVRVMQGFEPPAFLNLFRGAMVVHSGRRDSPRHSSWRLFVCRGVDDDEAVLVEVPSSARQLRSAASFVLVNGERRTLLVWHGLKSPEHIRRIAVHCAKRISQNLPVEFAFSGNDVKVREEEEGSESAEFFCAIGGNRRQLYYSFLEKEHGEASTPRLFHLSSVSGEFLFTEMTSPSYKKDVVSPFPFLQEDLYSAPQPALFLLDAGNCLWLWQGWWEAESGEGDRGSGLLRFQAERRAAMSTAISYWGRKHGDAPPKAYLVWAGLEPLVFTNLFPMWTDRDQISEISMKEGRKPGEIVPVKTELASLAQSTYPLAQLQSRPLPDGVNPSFLEDYLEPECFQTLFGMSVDEFHRLPSWKKKKLKQDAGLF